MRQPNLDGGRPGRHNVKTTPAEEAAILLAASQLGVTPARYLVESAVAMAGAGEDAPETPTARRRRVEALFAVRHALAEAAVQAKRVGVNVNQIARGVHVGDRVPVEEMRTYLRDESTFLARSREIAENIDQLIEELRERGIGA